MMFARRFTSLSSGASLLRCRPVAPSPSSSLSRRLLSSAPKQGAHPHAHPAPKATASPSPSSSSSSSSSNGHQRSHKGRWFGVPIAVGLAYVGFQEYRRLSSTPSSDGGLPSDWRVTAMRLLPLRILSRTFGFIASLEVPVALRAPLYTTWLKVFDGHPDEMELPPESYASLSDFFIRRLRPDARRIATDAALVSPADGRVMHFGAVGGPFIEQIKGSRYHLGGFLGEDIIAAPNGWAALRGSPNATARKEKAKVLHYCVIYLGPGDYHRFHSPTQWTVDARRHFPGELLSVSPAVVRMANGLFNFNERVVLRGQWREGFFAFAAIGATNVGSIAINMDPDLITNRSDDALGSGPLVRAFDGGKKVALGEEIGAFKMGSCIVLVFEASQNFRFSLEVGQKVRVGEAIGYYT